MRLGPIETFWRLTPRQLSLAMAGASRALVAERNALTRAAWLTASLPSMKRPPKLADLLIPEGGPRRRRRKTAAELEAAGRQWHAVLSAAPKKRRS